MPEHIESSECGCWGCVSDRQHEKRHGQLIECVEMLGFKLFPWQVANLRALSKYWPVENPDTEHFHFQAWGHDPLETKGTVKMWGEIDEPGN